METDYGRIRIQIEIGNEIEIRNLICLQRNYHNLTKGAIEVHLERRRNVLQNDATNHARSVQKYARTLDLQPATYTINNNAYT